MTPEDKLADAAYTSARATVDAGDKIIAAIDRNTEAVKGNRALEFAVLVLILFFGIIITALLAKAAPLVSDGDEIASVGKEVRR